MEENKYICPQCGEEMMETYDKPALNLVCPKCGCQIATSRWEEIDLDDNDYEIVLKAVNNPNIEIVKFVSKLTGLNFLTSKAIVEKGGALLKAKANEIKEKRDLLINKNIEFEIKPFFPYK